MLYVVAILGVLCGLFLLGAMLVVVLHESLPFDKVPMWLDDLFYLLDR